MWLVTAAAERPAFALLPNLSGASARSAAGAIYGGTDGGDDKRNDVIHENLHSKSRAHRIAEDHVELIGDREYASNNQCDENISLQHSAGKNKAERADWLRYADVLNPGVRFGFG